MPITCNKQIKPISQEKFHVIDEEMMELVFSTHNKLGSLCDEEIYKNELAYRCSEMGFETVQTEVPIHVGFKSFSKTYYMDLLINNSAMYEFKAVLAINDEHRKQALNYLLLTGLNHGKLLNMRPPSVQYEFVSTRLTPQRRYEYTVSDSRWDAINEDGCWLKQLMTELLSEWGAFLDVDLYYEAIIHLRGGDENVIKRIGMINGSRTLGNQRVHLLNRQTAFKISAVTKNIILYKKHLQKFLAHTSLKAIQWINFNHHDITFETLLR